MQEIKFLKKSGRSIVWLTDLHLDATDPRAVKDFFELIKELNPTEVLIGGDVSNGALSLIHLLEMNATIKKPIFFVLGNHDYYFSSIEKIRNLAAESKGGTYLSRHGAVMLDKTTALVGHDGWADGKEGDFLASTIVLNDYLFIEDLKGLGKEALLKKLGALGKEGAEAVKVQLMSLPKEVKQVIVLVHAPPFLEACRWEGVPSDSNWSPHFVSRQMGEVLKSFAGEHPNIDFLVLCGHSHTEADIQELKNLRVIAGAAVLGAPQIAGIIR